MSNKERARTHDINRYFHTLEERELELLRRQAKSEARWKTFGFYVAAAIVGLLIGAAILRVLNTAGLQ